MSTLDPLSNQIYIALLTSADITKCCTETQPKTPNSKQCRCRSILQSPLQKNTWNCHFSLLIRAVLAIIWTWYFTTICCIPPLPCHNTTDWLKLVKKERNSTNWLLTRHTCYLKCIPSDYLMKLVERMVTGYYMIPYVLFYSFDVFTSILQCRK